MLCMISLTQTASIRPEFFFYPFFIEGQTFDGITWLSASNLTSGSYGTTFYDGDGQVLNLVRVQVTTLSLLPAKEEISRPTAEVIHCL